MLLIAAAVVILMIDKVQIAWLVALLALTALVLIFRPGQDDLKRVVLFMIGIRICSNNCGGTDRDQRRYWQDEHGLQVLPAKLDTFQFECSGSLDVALGCDPGSMAGKTAESLGGDSYSC